MGPERLPEIEPLHLADLSLPESHPRAGEACAVFAFLIRHPDGPLLVDTGVGEGHEGIETLYSPKVRPLTTELDSRGLAPADIVAVINTHLHFDHCGQNALFPGTAIYVQRSEYEAAKETPLYTIEEWVDFDGANYQHVDGRTEIAQGVVIVPTPGHTPGHQSVLIESAEGRVLIAGHGAYSAAEFAGHEASLGGEWSDEAYAVSLDSLRKLRPDRVYFGHDAVVWEP